MFSTRIDAVAFDMDGLVLNTEDLYGEVGQIMMKQRGRTYRDEVRRAMIGLPAPQAFGVLIEAESLKETWQELQEETDRVFDELLPTRLQLMPGAIELLQRLEEKSVPRCIATSSTRGFANKALSLVGVLDKFDFVLTAADVPRGKPSPDIYQAAAAQMDYDERFRFRAAQGVMAGAGTPVNSGGSVNVTVNVAGSVTAEQDLVTSIRNGLLSAQYNGNSITLEAI